MSIRSYAQIGEDLMIAYLLGDSKQKRYIDVGCLWPKKLSNSFFFYEREGFGLCIDPNPEVATEFRNDRPRDTFLNVGIGAEPAALRYHMYANPVFNTFSPARAEYVRRKSENHGGRALVGTTDIEIITLDHAVASTRFAEACDGSLDFLTVDVEGLETEVIQSFSFAALRPRLVVLEHIRRKRADPQPEDTDLFSLMASNGYWLAAYTGHDMYFLDDTL